MMIANIKKEKTDDVDFKRKTDLSKYQELFMAMFKIPDREVHKRIINAINGYESGECSCAKKVSLELVETSTQTDDQAGEVSPTQSDKEINRETAPRRRRRKKCVPQVLKVSQHKILPGQNRTKFLKRKLEHDSSQGKPLIRVPRHSSIDSISGFLDCVDIPDSDSSLFDDLKEKITHKDVKERMLTEWEVSENRTNGFLPIHEAIMANDFKKLQRQIFVWKYRKVDLTELQTDEGDDPLQLSIKQDSCFTTIKILLDAGVGLNSHDSNSNNLIHLAVSYVTLDINCLLSLMNIIDLSLLTEKNDEGYTPLHIAVRNNHYIMCEIILKTVDEKLFPARQIDNQQSCPQNTKILENDFKNFYLKKCNKLSEKDNTWLGSSKADLKQRILNACDMKRGCTPLFYAFENKSYGIIYLLLSHLADPTIRNHSDQDARTYFSEYGFSLKIDKILTNVEAILKKYKNWKP